MDPWHWDSVAYTGVILLNDFNDFVGGELECMRMEKRRALKELARYSNLIILISYTLYQLLLIHFYRWPTKSSRGCTRMSLTMRSPDE